MTGNILTVNINASCANTYLTIDISQLGYTDKEWAEIPEGDKYDIIHGRIHDFIERPYWIVTTFSEKESQKNIK
jgi:hypothetical protein